MRKIEKSPNLYPHPFSRAYWHDAAQELKDTSVVVASYDIGDDMRGLIGVVGPTRMDYATVAARLTGFADGLTRLFGKQEKQELPPKEDTDT